jgi:hypothetical protein
MSRFRAFFLEAIRGDLQSCAVVGLLGPAEVVGRGGVAFGFDMDLAECLSCFQSVSNFAL